MPGADLAAALPAIGSPAQAPVLAPGRPGSRRAGPGGMRRAGRLRELLISGVVDSFGMALGWTVVMLVATTRGGLAEAALYNAAMLGGVVLSAPVTGWLSHRLSGRVLLRGAAVGEGVLRLAVLYGLISGAPTWLVAALITLMNVIAWAGFAGMRAEVNAVDTSARSMTRYAVSIAGVEASGTALAALMPVGRGGYPTGALLVAVFVVYIGSLLPTIFVARRARIAPGADTQPITLGHAEMVNLPGGILGVHSGPAGKVNPVPRVRPPVRHRGRHAIDPALDLNPWRIPSPRLVLTGGAVMLVAAGPALLAVPVTIELHGHRWLAAAAVAFSLGTLLSTTAVTTVGKLRLPAVLRWSLWGLGMLAGWILAPAYAPMVLFAQFMAGLCQAAFEGDMDARVAAHARPNSVTRDLAYSAAVRALGGAIAVNTLPRLVATPDIGLVASIAALALGATSVVIWFGLNTAPHLFRRLAH